MFINRNSCREERLDNESITFETIFFYELSLIFTYLFTSPISDTIPIKFANQSEKIIWEKYLQRRNSWILFAYKVFSYLLYPQYYTYIKLMEFIE